MQKTNNKGKTMPDNPNTWTDILNNLPPQISGVLMAMFIAVIRILYDNEETKPMRVFLEALLCGALSLAASSGILAMGLDINWAVFVGGSIGYFGSASVRDFALNFLDKKIK